MTIQSSKECTEASFYQECIPITNYALSIQESIAFKMLENEGMSLEQIMNKLGIPSYARQTIREINQRGF